MSGVCRSVSLSLLLSVHLSICVPAPAPPPPRSQLTSVLRVCGGVAPVSALHCQAYPTFQKHLLRNCYCLNPLLLKLAFKVVHHLLGIFLCALIGPPPSAPYFPSATSLPPPIPLFYCPCPFSSSHPKSSSVSQSVSDLFSLSWF